MVQASGLVEIPTAPYSIGRTDVQMSGTGDCMGILGISNRTENWKTARTFAPFFADPFLPQELARRLGEPRETRTVDIQLELFWKGMRDHLDESRDQRGKFLDEESIQDLASRYEALDSCLGGLRELVESFENEQGLGFWPLKPGNYGRPLPEDDHGSRRWEERLAWNLANTEIDIVVETPGRLYVGEAKDESGFHSGGELVLVHQLIRQYVMARILVGLRSDGDAIKEVVPFIVRSPRRGRESAQVGFMVDRGWLCKKNILSWSQICEMVL